jgi:hypothetical protein
MQGAKSMGKPLNLLTCFYNEKQHLGDDDIAVAKILLCMADILSLGEVGKHESAVALY